MNKYLITQKITLHMIGAVVLAVTIILGSLLWMSKQQDKQSANASVTMISGGVEALGEKIRTFTTDYAWWQDALDNVNARNEAWIYSNMASGVTEADTADILAIVAADGQIVYGWDSNSGKTSNPDIVPKPIGNRIVELLSDVPVTKMEARQAFAEINGQLVLLATARISPDDLDTLAKDARLSVLIMGFYLTPDRIKQIGSSFLIDDLVISSQPLAGKSVLPLNGIDGGVVGYLCWTPQYPGQSVLAKVISPVAIALALFALFAWAATANTRRLTKTLASSEAEASRAARNDTLSGLPNRLSLTELIAEPETSRAATDGKLAVIYVDINGFKAVNDTIGHSGGDIMIQQIANRLRSILPENVFLARVGGDEFNLILTELNEPEEVFALATQIISTINPPYSILDMQFQVTASVGYAISTQGQWSPLEVVRHADVAMYHAKASGAQEPVAYEPAFESGAFKNKQIEEALRRGLENNEFKVVFQPILRSCDGEIDSVEALVRWSSDELGPISPATFIPIAENTGLISDIGILVMRKACNDLARLPSVKLNINISPMQLREPMFVENMVAIADEFEIQPMRMEFELTEGIIVDHPELACKKLNLLKDAGFGLALDDFGTGFSSIGYLRRFPFDRMKIDRSFINEIGKSTKANSLLQSLITLGDALDMQVVAEGIETAEQGELLTLLGCEYLQGFHYSRPVPIDEISAALKPGNAMQIYSVK